MKVYFFLLFFFIFFNTVKAQIVKVSDGDTIKINGETIPLKKIKVKEENNNIYKCFLLDESFEVNILELDNHILSFTT